MRDNDLIAYKQYQLSLKESFREGNVHSDVIARLIRSTGDRKIIVYPALLTWDTPVFNRPHQLLREFSRRGHLVFFLTPDPKADRAEPIRQAIPNLYLINDIGMLYCLRNEPVTLWVTWTPTAVCKELFCNATVVYDWLDELDVFGYYSEFMEIDHQKLLYEADYVFASSDSLLEKAKVVRQDAVLVPNGVCIEDFECSDHTVPEDMEAILAEGKPVIGFYGLLDDWRMDYDLVNHICKGCRDFNFVFIGPSYDGSVKRINKSENFFYLGPKDYGILKYYLRCFDAAIIPYKLTRLTESVFPMKLCEYMAAGKPVVTTDMRECRKFKSVFVSGDYEEFVQNMRKAITLKDNDDGDYRDVLYKEAHANTWKARVDVVINTLDRKKGSVNMPLDKQAAVLREELGAYEKLLTDCLEGFSFYEGELRKITSDLKGVESRLDAVLFSKTWRLGQFYGRMAGPESPIRRALNHPVLKRFMR